MPYKKFHYTGDIDRRLKELRQGNPDELAMEGENMALDLFRYTALNVPAYKKFLKINKILPEQIQNIGDFGRVPISNKDNYLCTSLYQSLFPNGDVSSAKTISATSGSTGLPFYFPRGEEQDEQYQFVAEIFLKNQFEIDKKKTLVIIGFALGVWIGGIFTYKIFNKLSVKYKMTILPVGTNKDIFIQSFKKFAPFYEQIILAGYPPFIKDVVDSGKENKIIWKKYNIKIITAAEGYSEKFRLHIAKILGVKNYYRDIVNMYGTVEHGTIATENSFSNLIRNIAYKNKAVFKTLFPQATNIPTLAQYYPSIIYFEESDGVILATGFGSSIPLVRYKFADLGGIIGYKEIILKLKQCGIDILKEAKEKGLSKEIYKVPFVYVYARADLGIVFRGANIYPGEIKNVIDGREFRNSITGKFTLVKSEDNKFNQKLIINIELKKGVNHNNKLMLKMQKFIIEGLVTNNSEYKNEYQCDKEKCIPDVVLLRYQDPAHFMGGGKHSWVKK